MIKITTNGGKLRNEYKVAIDPSLSMIHPGKFKLKFSHFPQEDGFDSEIIQGWETWISAGGWSTWKSGGCSRCDISLYTEGGTHIFTKTWNAMLDGDKLEQAFSFFCKSNPKCKGIVIGSHDGAWGHWVDPVREMGTECLIIEGSKKQFAQLEKNYSKYANCTLLNHIVTVDGEDVTWYTTDKGYSDSVIPGISEKFNHVNDVLQETHPSKSINEIIRKYGYEKFDFLHLDLEGYDADLIMGLEYFPRLIVFENEHVIHAGKYDGVINFLKKEGYNIIEEGIDTMAVKC
jgi:FkbM family methyltransferase